LRRNGLAAEHLPIGAPQKARRQFNAGGRANAGVLRERDLQPFGNAVALHEENRFFQRIERMAARPVDDELAQVFKMVTVQNKQAGLDGSAHGFSGVGRSGRVWGMGATKAVAPIYSIASDLIAAT